MAEANIRVINITLNPFELRNEDSNFEIRCGENVRLVFSLPEGATDLQLTESGTLQVEAINASNGFIALAKEGTYTVGTLSELNAQIDFNSSETAYGATQAGAYNLVVALKDASGNIVLSGVVPFNLYDVGYDGIVTPPESFRDEVFAAAERAVAASDKAQISEQHAKVAEVGANDAKGYAQKAASDASIYAGSASDSASNALTSEQNAEQSKNAANSSALSAQASAELAASLVVNATELGQIKLNKGVLHCLVEGDYSSNKGRLEGTLANILTFPLSIVWRGNINFNTTNSTYVMSVGGEPNASNSDIRITVSQFADNITRIYMGTTALVSSIQNSSIQEVLKEGINNFALIITTEDNTTYSAKFYINGSLFSQSSSAITPASFTNSTRFGFNKNVGGAIGKSNADYSDIAIFNFDISDAYAPYTISDYASGVQIPGTLLNSSAQQKAILALENFTFTNGSTRIVADYSGNLSDASVVGSVIGDNDTKIARLTSLINSQIPTA